MRSRSRFAVDVQVDYHGAPAQIAMPALHFDLRREAIGRLRERHFDHEGKTICERSGYPALRQGEFSNLVEQHIHQLDAAVIVGKTGGASNYPMRTAQPGVVDRGHVVRGVGRLGSVRPLCASCLHRFGAGGRTVRGVDEPSRSRLAMQSMRACLRTESQLAACRLTSAIAASHEVKSLSDRRPPHDSFQRSARATKR